MLNLNEFQADWAAMPQVEKEKLEKLNNKTILVSGHSLARCLCYALIYQSERQKRQIRVIYAGDTDGFDKGCTASEYFQAVDFDSLEEIKESSFELLLSTFDLHADAELMKDNIMTEYEERFSSMGNPICKYVIRLRA